MLTARDPRRSRSRAGTCVFVALEPTSPSQTPAWGPDAIICPTRPTSQFFKHEGRSVLMDSRANCSILPIPADPHRLVASSGPEALPGEDQIKACSLGLGLFATRQLNNAAPQGTRPNLLTGRIPHKNLRSPNRQAQQHVPKGLGLSLCNGVLRDS